MDDKLVLIDGNSILFREFYALPITMKNAKGEPTNALYGFANQMLKVIKQFSPSHIAVAFDVSRHTFRSDMYEGYKATRKSMPDELRCQIAPVKTLLKLMNISIIEKEGFEGDDILGSLSRKFDVPKIIITGDRDSFQLINQTTTICFNKKGLTDVNLMDEKAMLDCYGLTPSEFIVLKALAGDSSDNIPGVKGIGEKTAIELVKKYNNLDNLYAHIDELTGATKRKIEEGKDDAYLSYKLATIKTDVPIDQTLDDLKIKLPFSREVYSFFAQNSFKSLVNKSEFFEEKQEEEGVEPQVVSASADIKASKVIDNEKDFAVAVSSVASKKEFSYVVYKSVTHISDGVDDYTIKFKEDLLSEGLDPSLFRGEVKKVFEDEAILKVLFDSKTEKHNLLSKGIEVSGECFDCMIAKHLVCGESVSDFTLISADFERLEVLPALTLVQAKVLLEEDLNRFSMMSLYRDVELPLSVVLFDMENCGFHIDRKCLSELDTKYSDELEVLKQKIYDEAGEVFNINSPKQLSEIIYDKLKLSTSKKKSTAVEVLEGLEDKHPMIPLVIRYRKVAKYQSGFIRNMYEKLDANDFVHTTFNQTVTTTGRLSSAEPNLQNIPVRGDESREIRAMFTASCEDNVLIDADYSQIELRVLAHLSEDELFVEAFKEGKDIHSQTASAIFGVPEGDVTPDMRRLAKVVNFGINYGMSEYGLAKDLKISSFEAKEYIKNYYLAHPNVKNYMEASVLTAKESGRVVTILGRTRNMVELNSPNYMVRQSAERASQNMPIQGSAADIIKLAMLDMHKKLKAGGYKAKLIMQVHDELIVDCPKSEQDEVKQIVISSMENAYKMIVPLEVDCVASYRWSDGH